MINRVRKSSQLPSANGISGGFVIDDSSERIKASVNSAEDYPRFVRAEARVDTSGAFTITDKDDGKNFVAAAPAGVGQLPKAAASNKGMRVRLTVGALSDGTGHSLSPNAADFIGGNGLTETVDKDLICTEGTDRLGDTVEVESNGSTGWYITSVIGTWAKEA